MKFISTIIILVLLSSSAVLAQEKPVSIPKVGSTTSGVGLGVPYGVLGVNTDLSVSPNVSLTLGLGTSVVAGTAYNFGLKCYLTPPDQTFRPRISAYYGVNAIRASSFGEGKSYRGISLGAGAQWMWGQSKKHGLDFDVMYLATSAQGAPTDGSKVKISIGYRHGS